MNMPYNTSEIVLTVLAVVAVAAYLAAVVMLAADQVVGRSTELAQMVAGIAHLNPGTHPQCDGSPS